MKISEFRIEISPRKICSMIDADKTELMDEILEETEEMLPEAYEKLHPAAYLGFGSTEGFLNREDETPGQEALYVICTAGPDVCEWYSRLFREGDCVKGMLADAIADECLFQMDRQLEEQVTALCRERGRGIKKRLEAPQDVPMEIQMKALEVTGAARDGIDITGGLMYRPVKTVCQVFLLSDDPAQHEYEHDCSKCGNLTCRFRNRRDIPVTVITEKETRRLAVRKGVSLLDMLRENGIYVGALCSGRGTCGKCRITVERGEIPPSEQDRAFFTEEELEQGVRLACTAYPDRHCTIRIGAAQEEGFQVCDSGISEKEETSGISELSHMSEATDMSDAPDINEDCGVAVDIGTTTVVMRLTGLESGRKLAVYTALNRQRMYGADVIGRISAVGEGRGGELRRCILDVLEEGIASFPLPEGRLKKMVIGANTTMVHLLMGYPCNSLGVYPFTPYNIKRIEVKGGELFPGRMDSCDITVCPGVSTFIGGDITAGLYALDFHKNEKVCALIDLGTNGEMAVGNCRRILAASAAAGPAFEGGNIVCGTGSIPGAICRAEWDGDMFDVETIGGAEPAGICGTGIVDIIYGLLQAEIMDETGRLEEPYDKTGFPVAQGKDIRIWQKDIREIQLAKSAVRAGFETLLHEYGIRPEELDCVWIAGGFGCEMDIKKAVGIGLLPETCMDRIRPAGNTCLQGVEKSLSDRESFHDMEKIAAMTKEIPLSGNPRFAGLYMEYMSFEEEE